jgi:2-polyprenyl-3-methyl-5-hydroxy-6-metoxy-1,4-benzoquinol methylase
MVDIADKEGYLARMGGSMAEKLRVAHYFPEEHGRVLDVGCANAVVTKELAKMFPESSFLGIDIDSDFIAAARDGERPTNVVFEKIYLRELLARGEKYDLVTFLSVLHEFYTYGEGISSVLKAVSDAHEVLRPGGRVIIRDMILSDYVSKSDWKVESVLGKISNREDMGGRLQDFAQKYGEIDRLSRLNHFLLKYRFVDNWEHELPENYTAVTMDQYESLFALLGMKLLYKESYLIDFLAGKWREDFGLTEQELAPLRSTTILVAEKVGGRDGK